MHRSIGRKAAAGLGLAGLLLYQLTVPAVAAAQSRADLEQRIRDLERKLDRLERLQGEGALPASAPAKEHAAPPVDEARVKAIAQDEIKKTKPLAGWKDGFFLESPGGDFKLKLRGYVQADARWFPNTSGDDGTSAFFLRRVRPIFEGTVYKYFDYRIMPDFGGSGGTSIAPTLQDAYADVKYFPYARFRAGKYKTPFSLERLQSGASLLFVERSLAQNLAPNRDVGFMLHGDPLSNGVLYYELGVFNGTVDGGSVDGDVNSDKELAGRFFVHPFATTGWPVLQSFGFGVAGTYGNDDDDPIDGTRVQTAGRATIYRIGSGVTGDGTHSRLAPQVYYFWGPFGMMGEYFWSDQAAKLTSEDGETSKGRFTNSGGFLQASWVLTGEDASYKGVVPINGFDPVNGRWGAFEIAARGSWVDLGNEAFDAGFASPETSVGGAVAYTAGLNWYWNANFKVQLNYERTEFDRAIKIDGASRSREDVLLTRFQVSF